MVRRVYNGLMQWRFDRLQGRVGINKAYIHNYTTGLADGTNKKSLKF